jgi:hypothetical protein
VFEVLLERIAAELARSGIPYMVIGGQAVLIHGEPRATRDIDVTLGLGADGYAAVSAATARLGLRVMAPDAERFVREHMVLPAIEDKTGIRVDFIFSFTPYEQQAIVRAVPREIGAGQVRFATLEDVIIHKLFAGRPRDIEDVRSMLARNPGFDRKYIEEWLPQFREATGRDLLALFRQLAG